MPKVKLSTLFEKFRPNDHTTEDAWIETAEGIGKYVDKAPSVDAIKSDFSKREASPTYQQFEEIRGKRTVGSLLYGKLSLDAYLTKLEEGPEKELLNGVTTILGDLYKDAKGNRDKVLPLLEKVDEWLTKHAVKPAEKTEEGLEKTEEAIHLMKGLYTMLSCLDIKMGNVPSAVGLVPGASALVEKAKTELPKLLAKTEQLATTLQAQKEEIVKANAGKAKSMDELFSQRYGNMLNEEGTDQATKLATVKSTAVQNTVDIESLLAKRQEKTDLENNITKLQGLLKAASENDNRVRGRKYFHELVNDNQENYNLLLKVHPEQTKSLETLRETIRQESILKTGVITIGSYLASPFAFLGRLAPEKLRNVASDYASIDTNDSLAKRQLTEMTRTALTDLKAQLKTKEDEISALEGKLANGNDKLQEMIAKADPEALQKIVTVNKLTVELVDEYSKVQQPILATHEKLKQIESLDKSASDFIRINDNALSKIGDFFSRFFRWNSIPSLSDKIAEAKTFKQDLKTYKEQYDAEMSGQMKKFDLDPTINKDVKDAFKKQLTEPSSEAPLTPRSKEAVDHFTALKKEMQGMKPPQTPKATKTPEPDPDMAPKLN